MATSGQAFIPLLGAQEELYFGTRCSSGRSRRSRAEVAPSVAVTTRRSRFARSCTPKARSDANRSDPIRTEPKEWIRSYPVRSGGSDVAVDRRTRAAARAVAYRSIASYRSARCRPFDWSTLEFCSLIRPPKLLERFHCAACRSFRVRQNTLFLSVSQSESLCVFCRTDRSNDAEQLRSCRTTNQRQTAHSSCPYPCRLSQSLDIVAERIACKRICCRRSGSVAGDVSDIDHRSFVCAEWLLKLRDYLYLHLAPLAVMG